MANSWLRLWHDMPTDPKWRTIARASRQTIGDVMSVYIHLLVCASNATERGRTQSFNSEDVASALDIDTEQVEQIVAAMQGRVLDGDLVKGWETRQVSREDGSAERSKAWREAKKLAETDETNAGERKQPQTKRKQPKKPQDTDTDTDTDKEGVDKSTPRAAKKCPPDFSVPEEVIEAIAEECPLVDIEQQTAIFRDHTFKTARTDWVATWRNWMRTKQERIVELGHTPGAPKESFAERDERMAAERYREATGQTARTERPMGEVIDITPKRISK